MTERDFAAPQYVSANKTKEDADLAFEPTKGRIMTKLFLTAALIASLAVPAFASEKPVEKKFTRNGLTYIYTTTVEADRVVLAGRSSPLGGDFKLVVRGSQVTGVAGGSPVSFTYRNAQAKLTSQQVASR